MSEKRFRVIEPKVRLKDYRKALANIKEDIRISNYYASGFCYLLVYRNSKLKVDTLKYYPEIWKCQPPKDKWWKGKDTGLYWFPIDSAGDATRIMILQDAIKKLEKKYGK